VRPRIPEKDAHLKTVRRDRSVLVLAKGQRRRRKRNCEWFAPSTTRLEAKNAVPASGRPPGKLVGKPLRRRAPNKPHVRLASDDALHDQEKWRWGLGRESVGQPPGAKMASAKLFVPKRRSPRRWDEAFSSAASAASDALRGGREETLASCAGTALKRIAFRPPGIAAGRVLGTGVVWRRPPHIAADWKPWIDGVDCSSNPER